MKRYIENQVREDLDKKMVFLGGPRQVGKTTVAKSMLKDQSGYLSWDIPRQREIILKRELPDAPLLVFDEIHKYKRWRNYLKGVFDEYAEEKKILVTGSARLDLYRYGGDSLQGRYYYLRLHPLSFVELQAESKADLEQLFLLGGFPEPFLGGSLARAKRWSVEYRNRLIQDDISSVEAIKDLGTLERLVLALPDRVGSPLSKNSLREDLEVNHQTVSRWLDVLERMYAIFRISPFGAPKIRAVKKEQKHYHFDWSLVHDEGYRFENLIASHLLKWIHFIFDTSGRELELRYFRDIDSREVDFVIVERKDPIMMVECKLSSGPAAPSLKYLAERFPDCAAYQVHLRGRKDAFVANGIKLWPAEKFLQLLP